MQCPDLLVEITEHAARRRKNRFPSGLNLQRRYARLIRCAGAPEFTRGKQYPDSWIWLLNSGCLMGRLFKKDGILCYVVSTIITRRQYQRGQRQGARQRWTPKEVQTFRVTQLQLPEGYE